MTGQIRDPAVDISLPKKPKINLTTTGISYLVLIVIWVVTDLLVKGFGTWSHTQSVLQSAAFLGIAAAGQTIVVMMAGIDLSVSGVMTLSAVVTSQLLGSTSLGSVEVIILCLLITTLIGVFNAVGIYWLRLSPLVMTVAMVSIIQGVLLIYTNGTPPTGMSPLVKGLADSNWFFRLPDAVFVWLLVSAFTFWLLHKSRFGRQLFAIGSNERAAVLSGVSVWKMHFLAYALSGLFAGLAGILFLGYIGSSYLTMGDPYQLATISAVVLGGTSILGGRGNYLGTIAGALLLGILMDVLTVTNVPQAGRDCILGFLLVALLLVYGREQKQR